MPLCSYLVQKDSMNKFPVIKVVLVMKWAYAVLRMSSAF